MIAAGAPFGVELVELLGQLAERRLVVEVALHEPDAFSQAIPDLLAERRPGVLFNAFEDNFGECVVGPVPSAEPDQCERGWQQPAVREVVDCRHQLLSGEVARHAEDHQPAGTRDAGHPLVTLVPQRITPGHPAASGPVRDSRHLLAASS